MTKQKDRYIIKQVLTFLVLVSISVSVKAQFYNLPNEYFFNTFSQRQLARLDSEQIHSSIQPYIPFSIKNMSLLVIHIEYLNT